MSNHFQQNIQNWVSVDNKIKNLQHEVKELRNTRNSLTQNIFIYAETNNLENAVIQITDGKLKFQNVVISPANMLIFQFLDIVCEIYDTVVLFTPAFPTYIAACNYIGVRTRTVPLSIDDGFQLTKKHIDEALSLKPKTIIINSGNNPTGAVYDKEVLGYLLEKAVQKDCWILSDETYGMLSFNKSFFSMLNYN